VSATVGFGRQYLLPLLPEFSRRYPGVTLDLHLDDHFADPKPQTPDDLSQHRCINFRLAETGRIFPWEFERDGKRFNRSVTGGLIVNDAEATCLAALKGMGLAQIGSYQAVPQINAGRLIPVLTDYIAQRRGHYICYLDRRHLPGRIFVCSRIRARDLLLRP
jgi:DNA-binding transcriptional LysR family regulator